MKKYKSRSYEKRITVADTDQSFVKVKIVSSKDAEQFSRQFYKDDIAVYESVFIVLMNNSKNTIGWVKISQGGITKTVVDSCLVAKYAIDCLAKGVVLVHNHPSGILTPSDHDLKLTKTINQALNLFDITLLDHIILTQSEYYSLADNGQL